MQNVWIIAVLKAAVSALAVALSSTSKASPYVSTLWDDPSSTLTNSYATRTTTAVRSSRQLPNGNRTGSAPLRLNPVTERPGHVAFDKALDRRARGGVNPGGRTVLQPV